MGLGGEAFFTAEFFILIMLMLLLLVPGRLVLGVLAPLDEVLRRAALALAGLAADLGQAGPPLAEGHHADAGLLALLGVLALATAVFVPLVLFVLPVLVA